MLKDDNNNHGSIYSVFEESDAGFMDDEFIEIDALNTDIRKSSISGRSNTIFSNHSNASSNLEDFILKQVIGKGAFGKVRPSPTHFLNDLLLNRYTL